MFTRYMHFFLKSYAQSDYLTEARARLLLLFETVFLVLILLLQVSMLAVGIEDFIRVGKITWLLIVGFSISLYYLEKGKNIVSANIFIAFGSLTVAAGYVSHLFVKEELLFSSYGIFIFPCIVLCTIFSTTAMLTIVSVSFTFLVILVYALYHYLGIGLPFNVATFATIDTIFSIAMVYTISLLITRIFKRNTQIAKKEAQRSNRQSDFIKTILQDSSRRVVTSMNNMTAQINDFTKNTQEQASMIEEATATFEEVSAGIDSVADSAQKQNENLESLTSILKELSGMINEMDNIINDTLGSTKTVSSQAESGNSAMAEMEEGMHKIRKSSSQMTDIISIINDISDQINLLSLNAAIEAARAGESGRGFAVVADEISKLADQTTTSVKEIEKLVKENDTGIQHNMGIVNNTVSTISTIITGINSINDRVKSLVDFTSKQVSTNDEVNSKARDLTTLADEISRATGEQKSAVGELVQAMSNISQISQSNSQGAGEMSDESSGIMKMVETIKEQIEEYGKNSTDED